VDLVAVIDVKENPPRPIRIPNVSKVGDAAKKAFRVSAKNRGTRSVVVKLQLQ